MKTEIKNKDNSQVEISVVLEAKELEKYRDAITKQALDTLEIDGFRKGKVPKDIAMKSISEMQIQEQMAQKAISERYIDIIKENNIKAIGHPEIGITKIAIGADLEFTITTAVLPEIKIGDYKKISKKCNETELDAKVSKKEIDDAILNLRKMRTQQELADKAKEAKDESKVPSWNEIDEKDLPALDDKWVTSIGPFKDLKDFESKMKENLENEKKSKGIEKNRISIIDGILDDSDIEVPKLLVDHEIDKMIHEFEHNITMTGMNFDEYLTSIKKTRDDYKEEWKSQGEKRAQTQLMLDNIASVEKIEPSDKEVNDEVKKIMEQYKDNTQVQENNVRSYVATTLKHQKVFEFLESLK